MLLRTPCPQCQKVKEYIAEQVGETRHCDHCGTEFLLKANNGRVMWQIVGATAFVLFVIAGLLTRAYWQGHKYDHLRLHHASQRHTTVDDDDDN
jgi:uncharacterized protein (DUF983 family)